MQVTLKRPFIAGKLRYRVAPPGSYTEIPDALRGHLPKTAVIHEGPVAVLEKEEPRDGIADLRAADPNRAVSESSGEDALKAAGMTGLVEVDQPAEPQTASDTRSAKAQAANRAAKKAARQDRADKALEKVNGKS